KRLFGVYGVEKDLNSTDKTALKPLYNFDGWQFIYSADGKKIQKDYLDVVSLKETGFFATAFMKDDNIVIAYRGTDESIDHLGVNFSIGINKVHDQLIEAVCFYEYIKKEFGKNKTISFTGHSLGGALAQSAYLYSGKNSSTITWNALGFGDFENKFKLDNQSFSSFLSKIYELRLPEFSPESMIQIDTNKILLEKWKSYKLEDVTEERVYESLYSILLKPDSNQNYRELLKKDTAMLTMLLRLSHNYSQNKVIANNNIKNYYIKYDLVPKIKTRIGEAIVIPVAKEEKENDKKKIPKVTAYHSVNLFLLYMTLEGNIDNTKMNSVFLDNAVKTNYLDLRNKGRMENILKSGTENITEKDSIKNDLRKYCLRLNMATKNSNIETLLDLFGEDVKNDLNKGLFHNCEYKEYSKDEKAHRGNFDGCFTLGQLNNVSIGGIIGGKPET
ncbi:MAG: Mbeg1-like protein, partial [Cetobacterium sp.]